MARTTKDPAERRDELMSTALALFVEHGYAATSIEQITNAVGVAKGTFYHYFATKQDLLEQMVVRFGDEVFDDVERALADVDGSAVDRLRAFVRLSAEHKLGRHDEALGLGLSLYSEENLALRHHLMEGWIARTQPILFGIVEQGIAEGIFDVDDASATADVWCSLWYDYGERIGERWATASGHEAVHRLARSFAALESALERLLGVAPGTLGLGLAAYAADLLETPLTPASIESEA